ncbi:recombinase family protein [Glycomyces buryatensis]|uniref:Recombinase family protein n=1 Tax=Glycomyces buryatensis TaxID=2570927 RepID=A0A4S8PUT9_9ACTN|nr:recombinase family protein [Glycomyces buryatensis]THV35208.1 recombinase family protein [Glycomyces buryatensis]
MTSSKRSSEGRKMPRGGRAVLYLRVSDPKQVNTDYDPEGNSIPAQRKACMQLAGELGLTVVEEYVEPGRSAKNIDRRPRFNEMMERARKQRDVDAIVIYMRSRIFRNAADAALTRRELKQLGVSLLSVKDPTADSISGDMLAGILDVVNEYQSRAAGDDIAYKMEAKAQRGGTPNRTRLGYLNVTVTVEGRPVRTVIPDPERAHLVRLIFEQYATGQFTFVQLREASIQAGLRTRPTKAYPAGCDLSIHAIGKILKDRYYLGKVPYKGREYDGRHEPLITPELFEQVQQVLYRQRNAGTRDRKWQHYLKGTVRCARCKRLLTLERAKSKTGRFYFYYLCLGRADGECDLPRMTVPAVEEHVQNHWATLAIGQTTADRIKAELASALESEGAVSATLRRELERELRKIELAEDQCVELIGNPDWPADKLTEKIRLLRIQRETIAAKLTDARSGQLEEAQSTVDLILQLLTDPKRVYGEASNDERRTLNQICFGKLFLDRGEFGPTVIDTHHGETAGPVIRFTCDWRNTNGATRTGNAIENDVQKHPGSDKNLYVREGGLEPPRP